MELTGKQKRELRSRGQTLDASVQVGHGGVTANVIQTLRDQMRGRDLVKVKLAAEEASELKSQIGSLAEAVGAALAGQVGRTALLYRPLPENEEIVS